MLLVLDTQQHIVRVFNFCLEFDYIFGLMMYDF